MKHKPTKRSISNKHPQHNTSSHTQTRRLSNSSAAAIDARTTASNKIDPGTGTSCFDPNASCFKANLILKSQKVIKRDLLRCSDQRTPLLSSHTLPTPRIHHGPQQIHPLASSSTPPSNNHRQTIRRRSLSADSHKLSTTNDPIGPWPDISISRLTSDANELLHPIKNLRHSKNPRVFSPKYYTTSTDNTTKFKFHSSPETYIDEYRKQKGYLLGARTTSKMISRLIQIQQSEDDQLSTVDTYSTGGSFNNDINTDRMITSTNDLSLRQNVLIKSSNNFFEQLNIPPSIPILAKVFNDSHHINNLPTIPLRNGHPRLTRHSNHHHHHTTTVTQQPQQQQQMMSLPPLTASSFQFISGMNSSDKVYSNSQKPSIQNHSKFFLIDGRHKRKISKRIHSDSVVTTHSQDHSELRATGGPVVTTTQRTTAIVVYQLPRRQPTIVTSQSDIG